ncbi:MAG: type II toxin-antitoxin system VapC family toxin [Balneolaceae bacterium]
MSGYVIDASVAAKWLFLEEGTDETVLLLEQFDFFYAPTLFQIELDSIITKKVRKKELTIEEAPVKKSQAAKLSVRFIKYNQLSDIAFDISTTLPVTLYDATYIATAILTNSIFYTADERLVNGLSTTPLARFVRSIYGS